MPEPVGLEFRHLTHDGDIAVARLPAELTTPLDKLPYGHAAYFDLSAPHVIVPISQLLPVRARYEGIANANRFMQQAAAGLIPKRLPITVEPEPNGSLLVADGNSTFLNALLSGWPDLPCTPMPV